MSMPPILYKYRDYSNEFNKNTLFKLEIFLASTSMFNDPYEGAIPFKYEPEDLTPENIFIKMREMAMEEHPEWGEAKIQEYCYEGQQKKLLNDDAHIEKFNETNRADIDKTFGILSLTPKPLNYLMWSHYANSHKGFCIGFDADILYEITGGGLGPVSYSDELPKLRLFGDTFDFHTKQLATKSKIWEYEEEYRVVKSKASKKVIKYPKEMIKKIFLGCKMDLKNKHEIIDFVKQNGINCEIIETSLDKEVFKLNTLRIY